MNGFQEHSLISHQLLTSLRSWRFRTQDLCCNRYVLHARSWTVWRAEEKRYGMHRARSCGNAWTSQDHKWNLIEVFPNLITIQQLSYVGNNRYEAKRKCQIMKNTKTSLDLSQLVIRVNICWDESGPSSVWSSCPKPRLSPNHDETRQTNRNILQNTYKAQNFQGYYKEGTSEKLS